MKMSVPLFLFPEEVWELILDELTDSNDAWNLFKALPELDINQGLQKKKHSWLFGMVIPHLIPSTSPRSNYIQESDLLNCRLVSKRWSAHVDTFLEGQNQLRAFHCFRPQPQVPGQFYWNTKTYLEGIDEDDRFDLIWPYDKYFLGGSKLDSHLGELHEYNPETRTVGRFLQEMETHPEDRSPFLSGAVAIFIKDEDYPEQEIDEGTDFWKDNDICTLIDKFGKYIYHLKIDYRLYELEPIYMLECLRRLPNLRSLCLRGDGNESEKVTNADAANFLGKRENSFPQLPQLETLRLRYNFKKTGQLLIRQYSAQIRKLRLEVAMWREEYSGLFPNLAELEVTDIEKHYGLDDSFDYNFYFGGASSSEEGSDDEWRRGGRSEDSLQLMLKTLQAPLLAKLLFKFKFTTSSNTDFGSNTYGIEDDIFQWLKRFPNLRYLNFGEECGIATTIEKGTLSPEKDLAPNLQFLSIRTSPKMSYDFLLCLPALEHLQLHVHRKPMVIDHSTTPAVIILEQIQTATMYHSNIWELLPKLRTVTLLGEKCYWYMSEIYTFDREGYDFHLKQANSLPSCSSSRNSDVAPQAPPLRPDIITYLKEMAEEAEKAEKKKMERKKKGNNSSDSDDDPFWDDWDWKVWERRELYGMDDYASDYALPFNPNMPDF